MLYRRTADRSIKAGKHLEPVHMYMYEVCGSLLLYIVNLTFQAASHFELSGRPRSLKVIHMNIYFISEMAGRIIKRIQNVTHGAYVG